jgi:hypothetical protein
MVNSNKIMNYPILIQCYLQPVSFLSISICSSSILKSFQNTGFSPKVSYLKLNDQTYVSNLLECILNTSEGIVLIIDFIISLAGFVNKSLDFYCIEYSQNAVN